MKKEAGWAQSCQGSRKGHWEFNNLLELPTINQENLQEYGEDEQLPKDFDGPKCCQIY